MVLAVCFEINKKKTLNFFQKKFYETFFEYFVFVIVVVLKHSNNFKKKYNQRRLFCVNCIF